MRSDLFEKERKESFSRAGNSYGQESFTQEPGKPLAAFAALLPDLAQESSSSRDAVRL